MQFSFNGNVSESRAADRSCLRPIGRIYSVATAGEREIGFALSRPSYTQQTASENPDMARSIQKKDTEPGMAAWR
jgi:hypothetical protein